MNQIENDLQISATGNVLSVRVQGKLTTDAYHKLVPAVDEFIREKGKLRILFEMHHFHGWSAGAMWQDFKFDLAHWKDIERLALVGDANWEEGMAVFCKPFTAAEIRYFDRVNLEEARAWIEGE